MSRARTHAHARRSGGLAARRARAQAWSRFVSARAQQSGRPAAGRGARALAPTPTPVASVVSARPTVWLCVRARWPRTRSRALANSVTGEERLASRPARRGRLPVGGGGRGRAHPLGVLTEGSSCATRARWLTARRPVCTPVRVCVRAACARQHARAPAKRPRRASGTSSETCR